MNTSPARRTKWTLLPLSILAVTIVGACSGTPEMGQGPTEDSEDALLTGSSLVKSRLDAKCLGANGGIAGNHPIDVACVDTKNGQGWVFTRSGTLKSGAAGTAKCLGSGGGAAGTKPSMVVCSGTAAGQKYGFRPVMTLGTVTWGNIVAGASGLCLTNSGFYPTLAACNTTDAAQQWKLVGCGATKALCGGRCVDPATDTANCGGCGRACAAGDACTAGTCVSPPPPFATCGACPPNYHVSATEFDASCCGTYGCSTIHNNHPTCTYNAGSFDSCSGCPDGWAPTFPHHTSACEGDEAPAVVTVNSWSCVPTTVPEFQTCVFNTDESGVVSCPVDGYHPDGITPRDSRCTLPTDLAPRDSIHCVKD